MLKYFALFFFTLLLHCSYSQDIINELAVENSNGAQVLVFQSETIRMLLLNVVEYNKTLNGKIQGYRIQLFSDYKNDSRERALKYRSDFINMFPDYDSERIYSEFEPPFVKVRVGDYRDENSALIDYKKIVNFFPDSYIVKATINYPSIE